MAELGLRSVASVQVVVGSTGNTRFFHHTFLLNRIERRGEFQAEGEANDRREGCGSLWKLDWLLTGIQAMIQALSGGLLYTGCICIETSDVTGVIRLVGS